LIFRVIDNPLSIFRPWNIHSFAPGARPDRWFSPRRLHGVQRLSAHAAGKRGWHDLLAIGGRAVGIHAHLPIFSNGLLSKDERQLLFSATDLTVGITVWMDANMDGGYGLIHVRWRIGI